MAGIISNAQTGYTDVGLGAAKPIDWTDPKYQTAAQELKAAMNNMSSSDA